MGCFCETPGLQSIRTECLSSYVSFVWSQLLAPWLLNAVCVALVFQDLPFYSIEAYLKPSWQQNANHFLLQSSLFSCTQLDWGQDFLNPYLGTHIKWPNFQKCCRAPGNAHCLYATFLPASLVLGVSQRNSMFLWPQGAFLATEFSRSTVMLQPHTLSLPLLVKVLWCRAIKWAPKTHQGILQISY